MFEKKHLKKHNNPRIVTSILLISMMLTGVSVLGERHSVIAQTNNTSNNSGNLNIEKESASNQIDLKSAAKVTNDQAIQTVLKNVSGQQSDVKGVELEYENGNLVYTVNVFQGNESKDVKVGAIDGKILMVENSDVEGEDNNDDGTEEGNDVGDNDNGEYENHSNKSNSTESIQKLL